jgi:hypothetical protein
MDAIAYQMYWNMKHIKGTVYDATLVPFEGKEYICGWKGTERHRIPAPVLFEANFKITRQSDYPCNDVNWPLMSPRMMEILRGIDCFLHRLVPVLLVDRTVPRSARYLPDGRLRPEVVDDRFAALQLTEHIDAVDWERSMFRRSPIDATLCFFDKLVLVSPPKGLPPLFRLSSNEGMLLVSAAARRALETAGLRGVTFQDLPGTRTADTAQAS